MACEKAVRGCDLVPFHLIVSRLYVDESELSFVFRAEAWQYLALVDLVASSCHLFSAVAGYHGSKIILLAGHVFKSQYTTRGEGLRPPRPLRPRTLPRLMRPPSIGRSRPPPTPGSGSRPARGTRPVLPFPSHPDLQRAASQGGSGHALDDLPVVAGWHLDQ